jgi:hypothetical protein
MAGRYLLRQGLFYPGLFFIGTENPAKESFTNCIKPVGSTIFPLLNFRISVKSTSKKRQNKAKWVTRETGHVF